MAAKQNWSPGGTDHLRLMPPPQGHGACHHPHSHLQPSVSQPGLPIPSHEDSYLSVPPSPLETPNVCSQPEVAHVPGAQAAIRLPPANPPVRRNPAFVLTRSTAQALGTKLISGKLPQPGAGAWGTAGSSPSPGQPWYPRGTGRTGGHPGFGSSPVLTGCPGDESVDHYFSTYFLLSGLFLTRYFGGRKKKKKKKAPRGTKRTASPGEPVLLNTEKSKSRVQQRPRFPGFDTADKLEHNEKIHTQK